MIDEREYFAAAHTFAEGRGLSFYDTFLWVRPPLYVLMLGGVFRVFGTDYLPTLLLHALLSAATLVPLAWLAHRLAGRAAARWTALLAALYLPFTLFAGLLLSETLFLFLFAVALAFLLRAHETRGEVWRVPVMWAALAGIAFGLATLTRANLLPFVPIAALWLLWKAPTPQVQSSKFKVQSSKFPITNYALRITPALALIAACSLVILPWMLRNASSYGGFFLDTTGGYNLWLGSVGVRDEARLQADLLAIPGHSERQQFALDRAWENISADLGGFIGKGLKESLDLWKPQFGSEERQVSAYTWGRVPAWHLAALLIFDDLLYLFVLALGLFALVAAPPHPLKSLTWLWVLFWVAISFVFFAVTRFRLPVVLALMPWAGVGLSMLSSVGSVASIRRISRIRQAAIAAAFLGIMAIVLPNIEWGQTAIGVQRWGEQEGYRCGEALLRDDNIAGAIDAYLSANTTVPDTRYALAAAYLRSGSEGKALSYLLENEIEGRFEPAILRGEAARRRGDLNAARSFFNVREVQVAGNEALAWAWDHLDPPEITTLELGSGLDMGYVRGFYGPERTEEGATYRWSGPRGEFRRVSTTPRGAVTWSGWRPEGTGTANARIYYDSAILDTEILPNSPDPIVTEFRDIGTRGGFLVNPFIGSGADPRLLGVRVFQLSADE